jgi:hypothetical protein
MSLAEAVSRLQARARPGAILAEADHKKRGMERSATGDKST